MDEMVQKKGVTAPVWQYFGFQPDEHGEPLDVNSVTWRLCRNRISTKGGNTTAHLRIHHPAQDAKLGPACREDSSSNQSTITGAFAKCTKHKRDSAKWRECTTGVPRYIVAGLLPFSTVEKSSSRETLQTLNSQYQLPSHTYSRTAVPETCDNVRAEVECLIKRATTDMWSGTNLTPYTSLTVHFIPPQWKLESKCLETMFFQTAPLQPVPLRVFALYSRTGI